MYARPYPDSNDIIPATTHEKALQRKEGQHCSSVPSEHPAIAVAENLSGLFCLQDTD